jgi:hypothetical protein
MSLKMTTQDKQDFFRSYAAHPSNQGKDGLMFMGAVLDPKEAIVLEHVFMGAFLSHADLADTYQKSSRDAYYSHSYAKRDMWEMKADFAFSMTDVEKQQLIIANLDKMDDAMTMLDEKITTDQLETYRWYQEI